ncbi:MAG: DNA primase [Candidatus Marinimicrobia bacterium]|jgi:DNA primase|nr:DNA primase [Candidatus Neomarinimicrobiota bacterium]MBT3936875.1 DNA primase [Candidatus Neomarinimicrobiota bacterium]MBT3961930.1 DNA primase [Candidatus Neomarinimicrobiota bacterium]MBT4383620.1 DNA primase [Candidatus Neomarinimicrobiota bacterium]MBT4635783.1 DNA primase [Candidatus Neomarinimicrobiota bacterium]
MAQIPQDTINHVRDTANIVDIVSEVVELKKRGGNYFGLCPFHNEKTPSFSVAPAKQIYHCFGCGAGGNAITFLMEYERIPFPEAVQTIGQRYGIQVDFTQDDKSRDIYSKLYELHEVTTQLYQDNLFSPRGEKALAYLKSRGFSEDIIKQFKLGLAIDTWNQLSKHTNAENISTDIILKTGLFSRTDKGTFDRFRSRIMVPIFNRSGKVIAFGGRIFEDDDPAKYKNSPETPLYKKSGIFYGAHATRDSIRKDGSAIIVEGYFDFLQLYQAGITNVVAVSGTALTENHARNLKKLSNKAILFYDADNAGGKAAIKSGFVLLKSGIESTVVSPPQGKDPDDWVLEAGKETVQKAIKNGQPFLDFHFSFYKAEKLKGVDRSDYVKELLQEITNITDGIIQDDLLRTVGDRLHIRDKDLEKYMRQAQRRPSHFRDEPPTREKRIFSFSSVDQRAQLELIRLLASDDPNHRQLVKTHISSDDFIEPILKKLATKLMGKAMIIDHSALAESFSDKDERDIVTEILIQEEIHGTPEQIVKDCLNILKSKPIKEKIQALRLLIREKEASDGNVEDEIKKVIELQNTLNELSN